LLSAEQTVEDDMFALIPRDVGVHFSRAPMPNLVNVETLRGMVAGLARAAGLIIPDVGLDVIAYACTSGSICIGEGRVIAELERGAPGAKATTLVSGVVRALHAVQARRIVVATPYTDDINDLERTFLMSRGFSVLDIAGMGISLDSEMVRVKPSYIRDFARRIDRSDADATFISCSALRSIQIIDQLEELTGKPVIASNQAMAWDVMRLAGIDDRLTGYGCLLHEA
jgi:maleate isomerase